MKKNLIQYESKEETTRYLIEDAGWFSKEQQDTIKMCIFKHPDTFALTQTGYHIMREHFIHHEIVFENNLTIKEKIILGGRITSPYYYDNKNKVVVFDNKYAFVANLGGGDWWIMSLTH